MASPRAAVIAKPPRWSRVGGLAAVAVLVVAVAIAAVAWQRSGAPSHEPVRAAGERPGLAVWLNAGTTPAPPAPAALPRSLEGLELPGDVGETRDGRLRLTRGVRDLFDHFLAGLGEAPIETLRARLREALAQRLGARALAEAMALFDAYLAYQQDAARNLGGTPGATPADLRARQASLRAARLRAFGPEAAQALFGDDDRYDDYALAKLDILRDASLTLAQRTEALAALRASLPAQLREALAATELVETLGEITDEWRRTQGTPQQLHELRTQLVGAAAAERLATLDDQNRAFDAKVAGYLAERERLRDDASVTPAEQARRLEALRAERFDAGERVRLGAREQMHDEATTLPR